MNGPISVDSRLLAAQLDDLAYDRHELADILAEIGAGDAGGGRVAVHCFAVCVSVCDVGNLESECGERAVGE